MQRLYFLVPDTESAKQIVDDLLLERIPEKQINVIAKDRQLLKDNDLPESGLLQERDIIPALERGVAAGGATGLIAGIAAVSFPPAGLALGGGAILATSVTGAAFGAIVGPMIGISKSNTQLEKFEDAIEDGQLLMMVDLPKEDIDKISDIVKRHHSEVDIKGTEPEVPPFP